MNLDQYRLEYAEAMAQQGVKVTWAEDGGRPYGTDAGVFNTPENWIATLSRDGVSVETSLSAGRVQYSGLSPAELAAYDQTYALRRAGQMNSLPGELPSSWFLSDADDYRRWQEMRAAGMAATTVGNAAPTSSPGPATTIQVGASIQQAQNPPNPNNGTVLHSNPIDAARSGSKLTFWQWNYYWEQQTGRSGPDPAEVGVGDGNRLMTGAEWVAAVGQWYGMPVSVPQITGGAGSGVGASGSPPPIVVGATGVPPSSGGTGGGTGAGGTTPGVGSTPPGGGAVGGSGGGAGGGAGNTAPVRRSFWEWNAIREQATGIVGDDPAHYSIMGTDLMTLAEWEALTSAYYANKSNAPKGMDSTVLLLGGLAAFLLLMRGRG